MKTVLWMIAIVLMMVSCSNDSLMPKSGGKPYDVLLVDDHDSAVYKVLDADVEGLAQPEPSFDISNTDKSNLNQITRLARNIVIVNVDSALYSGTRIRYEKNLYASPQIVVYVGSPSADALKRDMPTLAAKLRMLLTRNEMNNEINRLKGRFNINAYNDVKSMFDVQLMIPAEMTSSKKAKDFLWFSDNANSAMRNICVYSFPVTMGKLTNARLLSVRDSVMKKNIKGETDNMYMKSVEWSVRSAAVREKTGERIVTRGLWEMEGDAMGGSFVSHTIIDSVRHRGITVEAFLYAPEMKKRNKLRLLESALYTLDLNHKYKTK